VQVEADVNNGLHNFRIIGMADKSIDEAKDRVSAALKHTGFTSPKRKNQKVIISLAPAEIKKHGSTFDVPIALSYLLAIEEISFNPQKKIFLGELSLNGEINAVRGIIPLLLTAEKNGFEEVYIPNDSMIEGSFLSSKIKIYPVKTLDDLIKHLVGKKVLPHIEKEVSKNQGETETYYLSSIKGNEYAKRALIIAAAGRHNLALFGSPGTGKSMLAKFCQSLLSNLTPEETLEKAVIESTTETNPNLTNRPPFRSPHHHSSTVAILGGGSPIRPGEITRAHTGILFLDEFPEFNRQTIEGLREPLTEKRINISRSQDTVTYPADCMCIIAYNPCPCGFKNHTKKTCICSEHQREKYDKKISGPIVDRIELWVPVEEVEYDKLLTSTKNIQEKSQKEICSQIVAAQCLQKQRNTYTLKNFLNSCVSSGDIIENWSIPFESQNVLQSFAKLNNISARSYYSTLRVARTISDLNQQEHITVEAVLEALQYRKK